MAISIDELLEEKAKREEEEQRAKLNEENRKKQAEIERQKEIELTKELLHQFPELAKKVGKPMVQEDLCCGMGMRGWSTKKIKVWNIGTLPYLGKYGSDMDRVKNIISDKLGLNKRDKFIKYVELPVGVDDEVRLLLDEKGNTYIKIGAYHGWKRYGSIRALFPMPIEEVVKYIRLNEDKVKEILLSK